MPVCRAFFSDQYSTTSSSGDGNLPELEGGGGALPRLLPWLLRYYRGYYSVSTVLLKGMPRVTTAAMAAV